MDWIRLWQELVQATSNREKDDANQVERGARNLSRRWAKPDSTRDWIISQLDAVPDATVLDIGAGTGKWAILLSRHVRTITAIDSSPKMIQLMRENLKAESIANVQVIPGTWPEIQVEPHDFSLCSHGMYGCADWRAFVERMVQATRRTCFLLMRAPTADGIMAQAATRIWGHPYDSPNFQVAFNALLQMGIFPNVLMANTGLWDSWTSASLENALDEIKRRFGIRHTNEYDAFLIDLLQRRLTLVEGQYVWTPDVRSALIYWNVGAQVFVPKEEKAIAQE